MNEKELVDYCFYTYRSKLKTARTLYRVRRNTDCLFFCHLALEMLLKGIYVKKRKKVFPITHDLPNLVKLSGLLLTKEIKDDLEQINTFNLNARYDDYKRSFYKKADRAYTNKYFNKTLKIITWLKKLN